MILKGNSCKSAILKLTILSQINVVPANAHTHDLISNQVLTGCLVFKIKKNPNKISSYSSTLPAITPKLKYMNHMFGANTLRTKDADAKMDPAMVVIRQP